MTIDKEFEIQQYLKMFDMKFTNLASQGDPAMSLQSLADKVIGGLAKTLVDKGLLVSCMARADIKDLSNDRYEIYGIIEDLALAKTYSAKLERKWVPSLNKDGILEENK